MLMSVYRYSDHCYMVLALAKLVHLNAPPRRFPKSDSDSDSSDSESENGDAGDFPKPADKKHSFLHRLFKRMKGSASSAAPPDLPSTEKGMPVNGAPVSATTATTNGAPGDAPVQSRAVSDPVNSFRTLQRFKAGANMARIDFMESKSALSSKGLAVSVEQVSIFLTADNTVVSFFEHSAHDILEPILNRLYSKETILRRASDASMLVQSLIDAIIDLAIPVAAAYDDAIGTMEFEVLTNPDMQQPKKLYILSSELALLKNIIQPITSLVNGLRDHHTDPSDSPPASNSTSPPSQSQQPLSPNSPLTPYASLSPTPRPNPTHRPTSALSTVSISPLTRTYLADVEDHIVVLTSSLEQMAANANDLTSLIFNMMGAYQNESMKQLTLVTIFFLPLTFLTGYFGMNFATMWSVQQNSDVFFWYIAIPVQLVVSAYLLRNVVMRAFQRGRIRRWVRGREKRIQRREERGARTAAWEGRRMSLHGVYGKGMVGNGRVNGVPNVDGAAGARVTGSQAAWRARDARKGDVGTGA